MLRMALVALPLLVACGGGSACERANRITEDCGITPASSTGTPVESTVDQCDARSLCSANCTLDTFDLQGCPGIDGSTERDPDAYVNCLADCILNATTDPTVTQPSDTAATTQ